MKKRYWMFKRGRVYYIEDSATGKQQSLRTTDEREAKRLRDAKNDAVAQPQLNLALAKTYYAAHDAKLVERTWAEVIAQVESQGGQTTQERTRQAFRGAQFNQIREKKLIETTSDDFMSVLARGPQSTLKFLKQIHLTALGRGWLPMPILAPEFWPKKRRSQRRAITLAEHQQLTQTERNPEWSLYLDILWETGAAQSDAASLSSVNINWEERVLRYRRRKLGAGSEPALLQIGPRLEGVLHKLPPAGPFFPNVSLLTPAQRSTRFGERCKRRGITGVSLHSYRYSWAERAYARGYPERWAQAALGHSSSAVHRAYSKGAKVVCPSLEEFEQQER